MEGQKQREVEQKDQIATEIRWSFSRAKEADERYSGHYHLRTSRGDLDEKSLWELGLRPVFHFREERTKAHLFITVLANHLLSAIRHRLQDCGYLAHWECFDPYAGACGVPVPGRHTAFAS